jgi:benzoyl-CoA reductase subunit C
MTSQKLGEILDGFRACVSDPKEAYRRLRENTGKELIGYTMGDVPMELIHAASLTPVGVVGSPETIGDAAVYLPSFCCSLMRSTLDMGLNEVVKPLSGMVVGHICDTTRDFSGIWQLHVKRPFFHDWMPPKQMKRRSARMYILSELDRLKRHLEDFIGHKISDSELESSLALYENQRGLLEVLKRNALSGRGPMNAFDFYTVLKASHFMDADSFSKMVGLLLEDVEKFTKGKSDSKVPLLISGKIPEPLTVIKILEEAGGMIVDDDFLWGSRLIRQGLPSEGSPMERMSNRFLNAEPFP